LLPSFDIDGITSVSLQCGHCSKHEAMQGYPQLQNTKTMMTMTAGKSHHGDKDDNDDDSGAKNSSVKNDCHPLLQKRFGTRIFGSLPATK
jgi:hypothetical protein